jgi:hypothetical protein
MNIHLYTSALFLRVHPCRPLLSHSYWNTREDIQTRIEANVGWVAVGLHLDLVGYFFDSSTPARLGVK